MDYVAGVCDAQHMIIRRSRRMPTAGALTGGEREARSDHPLCDTAHVSSTLRLSLGPATKRPVIAETDDQSHIFFAVVAHEDSRRQLIGR